MGEAATRPETHVETTAFVGRRHELAEIKRMLAKTRLLTLTGPGGIGKSRLAARAAEDLHHAYGDTAVVDLALLEDGGLLEPTVAAALGLRDTDGSALSTLVDHLAGTRTLLVLDNCEHLLQPCAALVDRLLRAAPRLRIMTTSRQRIGTYGERLMRVPSLAVAAPDAPPAKIARCDAVRLFAERAARVTPSFRVNAGNARTIARIAQRLDGIPLALELAAARLRSTPPDRLLRELDDRFAVLNDGDATGTGTLPRHQTLRATMEWSHALCSPAEQRLWARLSLFPAGADLDTAEEICTDEELTGPEIIDLITALVDKSVLNVEHAGRGTRYRMLDSIRAYGREHLREAEEHALRQRYCAHYLHMVRANRVDRVVADQVDRYWRLQREIPNIRVAMESCFAKVCDGVAGLEIAATLWSYWLITGAVTEGRVWLDRGLALLREPTPARAMALWAHALLGIYQGDVRRAEDLLAECRTIAARIGDEPALAYALQMSGVAAISRGEAEKGHALLEEARARHRARGDFHAVGLNLFHASIYCASAYTDLAADLGQELLALCDEHNAPLFRAYALFSVAVSAWIHGDWQRAEELMREIAIPWSVINDYWGLAQLLEVLAWTAEARGDHRRAACLLGAADATWRDIHTSPTRVQYSRESHRNCEEAARRALGARGFAAAFRHGAALGLDGAVAYALQGEAFGPDRHTDPIASAT